MGSDPTASELTTKPNDPSKKKECMGKIGKTHLLLKQSQSFEKRTYYKATKRIREPRVQFRLSTMKKEQKSQNSNRSTCWNH